MSMQAWVARRCGLLLALALGVGPALADPVALAPVRAGQYQPGSGVDAEFLKVQDRWHQSSVLWNEGTRQFGSGVAVGSLGWGDGLWGLADWRTAHEAPTPGMIESRWSGRVGQIAFGDAVYNGMYGATWGSVDIAPLFGGGSQDNWTSRFAGYIRIGEAGLYNFSVLHDDGFYFKLHGAGGSVLGLSSDFLNPREVLGFASDLQLDVGLYAFELGAYDRLEAGVVELSWSRGGDARWSRVPSAHLLAFDDATPVPAPGTAALLLAALLALGATSAGRRCPRPTPRG